MRQISRLGLSTGVLVGLLWASSGLARWPDSSLRPILRPNDVVLQTLPRITNVPVFYDAKIRPVLRPGSAHPKPIQQIPMPQIVAGRTEDWH